METAVNKTQNTIMKINLSIVKKLFTTALLLLLSWSCTDNNDITNEHIFEGDVILDTNEKYHEFIENNYTRITGNLRINNLTVLNIDGLKQLHKVDKKIEIRNNINLRNINGFKNLNSVTGIDIIENKSLVNLEGLEKVKYLEHSLFIQSNENLTSLKGLDNLRSIDFILSVLGNPKITNLENLMKLSSVGYLQIIRNQNLYNLNGLSNLKKLTGIKQSHVVIFSIQDNTNLVDLCAITSLVKNNFEKIGADSLIWNNAFNPSRQEIIDGNCSQ
ncbi:hypothetical protein [uncultured Tenacibaculum sp.]|uniref:hypothetical protein n=1 Tax=uncultured Tenacibaculum sp. TaxID=174713 RepID=UPI0026268CBC|nr:hypothetical protein [uncultured Tenacibaculum sp.]